MAIEPLILAVDDELGIQRLIKLELTSQGFRVVTTGDGEEAVRLAEQYRPDLAILDIVMPCMSGLEVMRRLRERTSLPILLLTGKNGHEDRVRGLALGADDYLAKPFNPEELTARVRAVLRRRDVNSSPENVVESGSVQVDLERRLVKRAGKVLNLTRNEWMLLQTLAANAGKVMLNSELLMKVWGTAYESDLQYIRVWVHKIRVKLEDDPSNPRIIKTLRGIGYIFSPEATTLAPRQSL